MQLPKPKPYNVILFFFARNLDCSTSTPASMNRLVASRSVQRSMRFGARSSFALVRAFHFSNFTRNAATAQPELYDVVIIGGGPAGLTLATALKNSPVTRSLKTVLVEGSSMKSLREWEPTMDYFENRVSSLTPRSVKFLERIGAWDHIHAERVQSYDDMRVWDGISDARINFEPSLVSDGGEFEGEGTWEIAHMVENKNLQSSMVKRLQELNESLPEGVPVTELKDNSRVKTITHGMPKNDTLDLSSWPVVELEDGQKLAARLLVGADGANSPARSFAKIEARGWDYNRHGLVATVKLEWDDFRTSAFQRFLKTGPIALLPMPYSFSSLVWSCTPEMAKHLKSLSPEAFVHMVNAAFRLGRADIEYMLTLTDAAEIESELNWRLENTPLEDEENNYPTFVSEVQENSRASFPLKMKHCDTYVSERVALVGDAAHTTHPLAGQGLNMGQQDVESLVNALEIAARRGLDIGSLLAIEPYWAERYFPNHLKLGVVDKLHKLYSSDFEPLVALRSFGLNFVDSMEFIKKQLMKQASN